MGAASLSVDGCSVLGDDDVQCETDLHDAEPSGRPGTHRATTTIRDMRLSRHEKISSAQGNCSAKSLAALVMSSILPCPPCLPPVMLSVYVWGSGCGGLRGRGQGTFHPPCHILHDHMVLRPEGTSHNNASTTWHTRILQSEFWLPSGRDCHTCHTLEPPNPETMVLGWVCTGSEVHGQASG